MIFNFPKNVAKDIVLGANVNGIRLANRRPESVAFDKIELETILHQLDEFPDQMKKYLRDINRALSAKK